MRLLKPGDVLKKVMGYAFEQNGPLGIYAFGGELLEIAGLIDKQQRLVKVSSHFPSETQTFTAAHELGHAILHSQTVLHRDKPLDGSSCAPRNPEEIQADKFAAYFLMPGKLVEAFFDEIFDMPKFVINENTSLAMRMDGVGPFRQKCKSLRGLARVVAAADFYAGKSFNPLAKIFGVSVETMAIRLEELSLVEF